MVTATITNLTVHPVKGARGVAVQRWQVLRTGLRFDREWMVVHDSGKFLSQRELPKLALVVPELPAEVLHQPSTPPTPGSSMLLTAPGMPRPLQVPLELSTEKPLKTIRVWEWEGQAFDVGDEAAAWVSQYLGVPARLVRYIGSELASQLGDVAVGTQVSRPVDADYVEEGAPTLPETRLSDGYPILLASQSSLEDLNARVAASSETRDEVWPLPMQRFRPNVVLSGLAPWEEDKWRTVRFVGAEVPGGDGGAAGWQDVVWKSVKPCSRCKVTTINPATAEPSKGEPLDTLSTFRAGKQLGYKTKVFTHAAMFGWNLVPAAGQEVRHVLAVGDTVQLSEQQVPF